jgi:hypothetical protein
MNDDYVRRITASMHPPTNVEDFWQAIEDASHFIDGDRQSERRLLRKLDAFLTQWFRDHPKITVAGVAEDGADPMHAVWCLVRTLAVNAEIEEQEEAGEPDTPQSLPTLNRVRRCRRRPRRKRRVCLAGSRQRHRPPAAAGLPGSLADGNGSAHRVQLACNWRATACHTQKTTVTRLQMLDRAESSTTWA